MKKNQSKKMKQLKYLVLIPVLVSMLFYTSCSITKNKDNAKKELHRMYFNNKGEIKVTVGEKLTFLDSYLGIGNEYRFPEGKELKYRNLSKAEKEEFNNRKSRLDSLANSKGRNRISDLKIFNYKNNRKVIVLVPNLSKFKKQTKKSKDGSVSFMTIEKAPTFPGCDSGDKECFSKNIQKHFAMNFNSDLPNNLGLTPGRKRVFIGFKIDKEGNIVNVMARAPHPDIKDEVIRVMNTLPKVIPGEQDGEKVAVKYSIPFTLVIDEVKK